jgi:PleD family two-component response regulator
MDMGFEEENKRFENADVFGFRRERNNREFPILIADDNSETRHSLAEALRREGYEVSVAENGRAALDRFHEKYFPDRAHRPVHA